ncbi:FYVE zinc finger-domain-containing protein [Jimgerdemannia flammicorona]|uniref:FYVE zinc finger-domain-containing protein n=1 Tax=Jimgerdemannia flammicorona TaxID=994334 RepID=A0A433QZZ3_9FUNG|nr:FYVE zinc finger-domain-containing protein [Jimgerdemannia flammicorona]
MRPIFTLTYLAFDITTFTDNQPYDPLNFHVTVIVIVHENQRSTSSFPLLSLARPQFSAQALSKSDTRSPWSLHPSSKPSSKYDVPQRGWFWLTDWQIDYTDPHVDTNSGWQYARTFEEPDEAWVHMAPSSGFGWVRRRRWIRVMKRRMDLINGSGGENTQQENTEEEEAIQQEQESSGMDYIERAEVVLMNGKKRDTTNSGEEAEDEGFVLAGDEGRKGANLTVAREELKRYEEAIQILLTGIKGQYMTESSKPKSICASKNLADRNPHRKHQATTLATAHIKRAEQISAAVNGTDKPPQQPRNEELEEVGLFNNSPDIVYHAEGELTSNPWSQHLAGTPPLNTGGRLPPSRLSRAQSVAATITSVNTGRSSRNVDLVGGSDDEDEVGGSESVGRLARHNRDETESVTSSAFETIPQTPSTTNASGMAAQHARGGPRRSNTSMMLGQSTMMGQTYQWESDVDAHDCRRCGRRFTFLVRRHHCRRCGLVVCDRCSTCRTTLPPSQILQDPSLNPAVAPPISPSQPQRVCDICFADIGMPTTPSASSFSHPHRTSSLNSSFEAGGSTNVTHGLRRTDSNQSMKDCPACGKTLMDMAGGKAAQEQHVKECLEKGRGGSVSGVRYVVSKLDLNSRLVGQECPICFEEFLPGHTIARLNCLCSYHRHCIHKWFAKGKECPFHSR